MTVRLTLREEIARGQTALPDDQVILGRSALLSPEDRDLLVAVWVQRQPVRLLARLGGVSPVVIRHRVRRLIRRLHSPQFLAIARALPRLNRQQAAVARLHFLRGLSQRATAHAAGLGYYQTRRLISEVRGALLTGAPARAVLRFTQPAPVGPPEDVATDASRPQPGPNPRSQLALLPAAGTVE